MALSTFSSVIFSPLTTGFLVIAVASATFAAPTPVTQPAYTNLAWPLPSAGGVQPVNTTLPAPEYLYTVSNDTNMALPPVNITLPAPGDTLERCKLGCEANSVFHTTCIEYCMRLHKNHPEPSYEEKFRTEETGSSIDEVVPVIYKRAEDDQSSGLAEFCAFICTGTKSCVDDCELVFANHSKGYSDGEFHTVEQTTATEEVEPLPTKASSFTASDLPHSGTNATLQNKGFFDCRKSCSHLKPSGKKRFMGCVYRCLQCPKGLHQCGWKKRAIAEGTAEASLANNVTDLAGEGLISDELASNFVGGPVDVDVSVSAKGAEDEEIHDRN